MMMFHTDPTGFIYLPVPVAHYPAVLDLIAELVGDRDSAAPGHPGGAQPTPPVLAATLLWSASTLTDLYRRCKPLQRAILTRVATGAVNGRPAPYEALRAAMGEVAGESIAINRVAGNLAWISKYGEKATGTGKPESPIKFTDHGGDDPGSRWTASMEKATAEAWLAVVANAR
jgi:hypothetical protein